MLQCPKCYGAHNLEINVLVRKRLTQDASRGVSAYGFETSCCQDPLNNHWDGNSTVNCGDCGWRGKAYQLEGGSYLNLDHRDLCHVVFEMGYDDYDGREQTTPSWIESIGCADMEDAQEIAQEAHKYLRDRYGSDHSLRWHIYPTDNPCTRGPVPTADEHARQLARGLVDEMMSHYTNKEPA